MPGMDYWKLAREEFKHVFDSVDRAKSLTDAESAFFEHARRFMNGTISDYAKWSEALGPLRDDVLHSGGDTRVGQIVELLTQLIWRWEYGGMEKAGYQTALELSALASELGRLGISEEDV